MSATYSQTALEDAFRLVADADDWKRPIQAQVPVDKLGVTCAAIIHFTGTRPTVAPFEGENAQNDAGLLDGIRVLTFSVSAPGYRAGPAGDH